ncbi:MAG: NAD(P)-dependent oxidoreductase [Caldilineaceae bacterium]
MKVLVTGANGKLGTYIIRALAADHDLVLFSRRQPAAEFAHYPWIQGDLTDFAACQRAVEGVDAIQHIGAQPWPVDHPKMRERAAEQGYDFDATFKTNMLGTYYLMQAAVEAGVKTVVMAGSNCALGHGFRISNTPFPISHLPIDETHPTFPKIRIVLLNAPMKNSWQLQPCATASAPTSLALPVFVLKNGASRSHRANPSAAGASGSGVGWSEDVAHAHRLLMEKADKLPVHDLYFLNADDTTCLEPSQQIIERYRPDLLPVVEHLEGHQSFLNCDKLKNAVGWEHKTSWRQYL